VSSAGSFYKIGSTTLVAGGTVFDDDALKPQESISRTFVFYVPADVYDMLEIEVSLPSAAKKNAVGFVHTINVDGTVDTLQYKIGPNGVRREIKDDKERYALFFDPDIQLQYANSLRQLSLWRSKDGSSQTGAEEGIRSQDP
jgi:hypothetical protein